jgi:type IV pilus assembly protein PilA
MKSMQKGFTLIELMIVVAIIGILAAIALPQYQTYIAKTQVSRVMGEAGNYKTAIDQCMLNGKTGAIVSALAAGTQPTAPATDCVLEATSSTLLAGAAQGTGAIAAAAGTGYVQGTIANTGVSTLTATFGSGASTALTTGPSALRWTRDASGAWTCATTADAKFVPNGCTRVATLP